MRAEDKTVLVVDDTVFMVAVIEKALKEVGYCVEKAFSGEEALEKIKAVNPDIILLDVVMPGMSGFDVCEVLRKDFRYSLIPIIIITGQADEEDRYHGLEVGADDYVVKPFSSRELLARVHNTLWRLERMREVNPLSGLRGNNDIETEMNRRMALKEPFAVMYYDLNAFKPYNDVYGFAAGDKFIRLTADAIMEAVSINGGPNDFVGHIGGDDFVAIVDPEHAEGIAQEMISLFDNRKKALYTQEDAENGCIISKDREGNVKRFDLVGVAVAIIVDNGGRFTDTTALAKHAAEYKHKAKENTSSSYVISR